MYIDDESKNSKKRQRDSDAIHNENASKLPLLPLFTPIVKNG